MDTQYITSKIKSYFELVSIAKTDDEKREKVNNCNDFINTLSDNEKAFALQELSNQMEIRYNGISQTISFLKQEVKNIKD
jgi:hypothetical protein